MAKDLASGARLSYTVKSLKKYGRGWVTHRIVAHSNQSLRLQGGLLLDTLLNAGKGDRYQVVEEGSDGVTVTTVIEVKSVEIVEA